MINVSRAEAEMLRERGRGHDVYVANRGASRSKTYFVTTSNKTMKLLNEYRNQHNQEVAKANYLMN